MQNCTEDDFGDYRKLDAARDKFRNFKKLLNEFVFELRKLESATCSNIYAKKSSWSGIKYQKGLGLHYNMDNLKNKAMVLLTEYKTRYTLLPNYFFKKIAGTT